MRPGYIQKKYRNATDREIILTFVPTLEIMLASDLESIEDLKARVEERSKDLEMLHAGQIPEKYKGYRT